MQSARSRMLSSVEALNPGATVTEVVLIQQRWRWTWLLLLVAAAVAFAVGVTFFPDPSPITVGLVCGIFIALPMIASIRYRILAQLSDGRVQLLRSSKWRQHAKAVIRDLDHPIQVGEPSGLVNLKVTMDGEQYYLSRLFKDRFDQIVA